MNILGLQCGYNGSVSVVSKGNIVGFAKAGKKNGTRHHQESH